MRFVLIPTSDSVLNVLDHIPRLGPAQALERTLRTCDLLLTYALAIAGKPSMQWRNEVVPSGINASPPLKQS